MYGRCVSLGGGLGCRSVCCWGRGAAAAADRSSGVGLCCGRAAGGSGLGSGFAAGGGCDEEELDFFFFDDDFFEDEEVLFLSAACAGSRSRASGMAWGASSATISQGMGVIRCLLFQRRVGAGG